MKALQRLYMTVWLLLGVLLFVLVLIPALIYWILTGDSLIEKYFDLMNYLTFDIEL